LINAARSATAYGLSVYVENLSSGAASSMPS
jgi:hypothetical protein